MTEKKYRMAVGAIVTDIDDNIVAFQRSDFPEDWQGVEGGIDGNETPSEAIRREIYEEIGLTENSYKIIKQLEEPYSYDFPNGVKRWGFEDGKKVEFDGQSKYFFLIKLNQRNDDIGFRYDVVPEETEFLSFRLFKNAEELVEKVPPFKKDMHKYILTKFGL